MAAPTRANFIADPSTAAAFSAARSVCRRHAPDLFFAAVFLPAAKRHAIYAVWAFIRLIRAAFPASGAGRSACYSPGSEDQVSHLLNQRLDDIYGDRLELPLPEFRDEPQHVLYAVSHTIRRYRVPQEYWTELVEGYRLDVTVGRYATWAALQNHCYRTGGVIGLIAGCILGVTHSDAGRYLSALGAAIRLTRILREMPRDLGAGRLYLPLEDLVRFRVTQSQLASRTDPGVRELLKFQIARARELYREGAEGICWIAGDGSRMAASLFVMRSSASLKSPGVPARLSNPEKIRQLGAAWRLSRRKAGAPLPEVFRS